MSEKRVAILISGGGSNMVKLVLSMREARYARPVLVLANVPDAAGLVRAAELGVPTACVDHRRFRGDRTAFEADLERALLARQPDILCLAGFMRYLTPDFSARWQGRMLNIHPSLLPKYTGLNTHARAIAAGDAQSGCTVHEVTSVLDGGPILGQSRVPVRPDDSPQTLAARVLEQEHILYPAVLRRFALGNKTPLLLP